ncbi:MAG: hypothetical protein U0869_15765 [Chloroflexota bacterium]
MAHRISVPPDRLIVEYEVDPDKTMEVYDHAAGLREEGWRMLSIDSHVPAYRQGWFRDASAPDVLRFTVLFEKVDL